MIKSALLVIAASAALAGCGPKSGLGFRLPDGDAEHGRQAFIDLQCNSCHSVERADLPYRGTGAGIPLGGLTVRVRTYGELVTAVINPSHRLAPGYTLERVAANGESLMAKANLNDVMTVRQLTDLVAFLQGAYLVMPPQVSPYSYIYP